MTIQLSSLISAVAVFAIVTSISCVDDKCLPGIKEEVKLQVEEDKVVQNNEENNVEKEDKNDTWHRLVIEFVKKYVGSFTPFLAGNSVYVDLLFLKKYMPDLAGLFPHVLVDVSSVKVLCIRWYPKDNKKAPQKKNNHRAMDDIKESIRELKYYKDHIFKCLKSKR